MADSGHDADVQDGHKNRSSWWQKYRLPVILAVVAVSFYIISLVSIIYGRGPVG